MYKLMGEVGEEKVKLELLLEIDVPKKKKSLSVDVFSKCFVI